MKLISEPIFRRPQNRAVDVYFDAEAAGLEPEPTTSGVEVVTSAAVVVSALEITSVELTDALSAVEEPEVETPPSEPSPATSHDESHAPRVEETPTRPGDAGSDSHKSGKHRRGGRHRHRRER